MEVSCKPTVASRQSARVEHFPAAGHREHAVSPVRQGAAQGGMLDANVCASSRPQEHAMFAYFLKTLRSLLERAEHSRRDTYLASAADIVELERRMRVIEAGD